MSGPTLLPRQRELLLIFRQATTRLRFEREFVQEYEPTVLTMLKELDKLAQVIAQAQKEVK